MTNRRTFLQQGSLILAGTALAPSMASAFSGSGKPLTSFGLQLYTLRDDLPKDPKGILKQVAAMGYKQVESFEGEKGMFWGLGHKGFKSYLDELGMTIVSSHCDTSPAVLDKKAAEAAEIGMKYLINPWIGPQKTLDDYKKRAEEFNQAGETCRKHGIRFAYHNHGYTFVQQDGQYPMDILMANSDPKLVDFEMDIYWVVTAGADPATWLKKYPNRFRLCHVKDRQKGANPKEEDASVDVGTGSLNWSKILGKAKNAGMQYYIVEQEKYEGTTPLKSAAVDAQYLKKLSF
jgi:sugar phosphate isomerase/epimerase